ncbi:tat twin-arginine translocation pathway signal sequence domain protein [Asticcacaulis biprosthecium C19]|uniref:Tat twin-arginine translocation pathway signal sequence domain protein n=1 Tax=Asticcacaulis biprosthecium C19 TaxID=715226 RepID=F4QU29_9CAUL|nr:hypothetical protein [Asticcacaulis biprosthecium]EGF89329.1 tat twin-arginine translocation pathway signal sequence domain protein [Asticcacaulis biprosthecium C19]
MTQSIQNLSRRAALTGLAGTAAFVAAPAFAAKKDKAPPSVTIGSAADGLANADALLARYGKFALPEGGRIAPPFFSVELVEQAGKVVEDRSYRSGAVADSTFVVEGVNSQAVQAAVDRLYTDFLAGLTASGYVLVPDAEVEASAGWQKLKPSFQPSPWQTKTSGKGKSTFYGPTGKGIYVSSQDTRFSGVSVALGFGDTMGRAFAEQAIPAQISGALMGVELAVGFVDISSEGGGKYSNLFGSGSVSIDGKAVMTIIPSRTKLWFMPNPVPSQGRQELYLDRVVVPATTPITAFKDVTSRGEKLGDVAGTMIGMLAGGGKSYSTKTFQVTLDPEAFPATLETTLAGVTGAMQKRLAELPSAPAGNKRS